VGGKIDGPEDFREVENYVVGDNQGDIGEVVFILAWQRGTGGEILRDEGYDGEYGGEDEERDFFEDGLSAESFEGPIVHQEHRKGQGQAGGF